MAFLAARRHDQDVGIPHEASPASQRPPVRISEELGERNLITEASVTSQKDGSVPSLKGDSPAHANAKEERGTHFDHWMYAQKAILFAESPLQSRALPPPTSQPAEN